MSISDEIEVATIATRKQRFCLKKIDDLLKICDEIEVCRYP